MASAQVEAAISMRTYAEVRNRACNLGPKRVGVVLADDEVALTAVAEAMSALRRDTPRLRAEVAAEITRKRAPELCFVPAVPEEGEYA